MAPKASGVTKVSREQIAKGFLLEGVMSGTLYRVSALYTDHFSAQAVLELGKKPAGRGRVHQFKYEEVRLFMEPTQATITKYQSLYEEEEK